MLGEKGVGKTILVRAVLDKLRQSPPRETLFLLADCRRLRTRRDVLTEIAQQAVERLELRRRVDPKSKNDQALFETARALRTLCNFDADAELKVVEEHMTVFKAAAGLNGEKLFLSALGVNFNVSVERKRGQELVGKVRFDEQRLLSLFLAFFRDVRSQGLHVVLHLDNIDELRHQHYQQENVRQEVRRDVDSILSLRDAPIGLVLGLRTYYAGSLPREVTQRLPVKKLGPEDLLAALRQRALGDGPAQLQQAFEAPPYSAPLRQLALMSRTPLAFLQWAQTLFDTVPFAPETSLDHVIDTFLQSHCSNLPLPTIRRVCQAFLSPEQPIPKTQLLGCCDQNPSLYNQLLDCQVVLPMDFFHPEDFTLDPELDAKFRLLKASSVAQPTSL